MTAERRSLGGLRRPRGRPILLWLVMLASSVNASQISLGPTGITEGAGSLPVFFGATRQLAAAPSLAAAEIEEIVDRGEAGPARSERPRKIDRTRWRRMALASASLAVAGAAAAHWSKGRADRAYDRYLHAADPQRRDRAIDRAERYDRLAGAGFVVMEAGLAACAYLVFF